jgi:signal transduction histidine kinase
MTDLLDRAPCGFVSFGSDGIVRYANTTLLELIGAAPADVVGRPFESLLTISSRIFYQTHFFPMLRLHSRVEEVFLTLRCVRGGDTAVLANASPREEQGGVAYDCVLMPLRERRKWEDEMLRAKRAAEEANRAKSGLLSMMSHDLRTPIGAISGYCDILTLGIRGPMNEAQLADVQRMKKASEYLLGLIDDVLSYARLNAGQIENLTLTSLDADTILARTETLMGPRIEQAGVEYRREGCEESLRVMADPDRLQQILLNVLGNAVKFTPPGGTITVSCEAAGDDLTRIHITDTGPGIPTEHLERIFEAFVQAPGGRASNPGSQKGFGLGLAISRELARRMNGDLTASSVVGQGSRFTLTLRTS